MITGELQKSKMSD